MDYRQSGVDIDAGNEVVRRIRQMAKGTVGLQVLVEGIARVRVDSYQRDGTSLRAHVHPHPESKDRSIEAEAHSRHVRELIDRAMSLASGLSPELRGLLIGIEDPLRLAYVLATLLDMKPEEKQTLEIENPEKLDKMHQKALKLGLDLSGGMHLVLEVSPDPVGG